MATGIAYALIGTAELNSANLRARLADTLAPITHDKITKVDDLLPWRWNGWRSGRAVPGCGSA